MPELNAIVSQIQQMKNHLHEKYRVKEIGIFGSYIRGEQTEKSDLDILVAFDSIISLFDFIALELELSDHLGIKVDLVEKETLKPHVRPHVLKEVVLV